MVIRTLKLVNYRRFPQLYLEFPENFIGIIGRNGAGKSTLMEAVGWVLFGTRISRTDKQEIRSQFAGDKDVCLAEMEFDFGGHQYRVVRKLKGKNAISEAAIYRDASAEPEAVQERGVNEYVESLLHLDYRSFFVSVFARQKDLAALSSMQPEDRRKSINRLINIDRIDKARETVRRDRNDRQSFVQGMRAALKDVDSLKVQLKEAQKEKKRWDEEARQFATLVKEKSQLLSQAEKLFETRSRLRDQFLSWQAQIGKLESRQKEVGSTLERLQKERKDIEQAKAELEELLPGISELDSVKTEKERLDEEATKKIRLEGRIKEKTHLQTNIEREEERRKEFEQKVKALAELQKQFDELTDKEASLESELAGLRETATTFHGQQQVAEAAGKEVKQKLEKIQQLGREGQCPVCTQTLGDHYDQVVNELTEQLEMLRKDFLTARQNSEKASLRVKNLEVELRALRHEKERIGKKMSLSQQAEKDLSRCLQALDNFSTQMKLVEKEIEEIGAVEYDEAKHQRARKKYEELLALKQRVIQLEERVSRLATVDKEIDKLVQIRKDIESDILAAQKSQAGLDYNEEDYLALKKEIEEKRQELDAAREQLSAVRETLARLGNEIQRLKAEIKEEKKKRQDIESAEEEIRYLSALDFHFGRFRLELASRIRPIIAHRASELLALTTNARYSLLELDEDYNIKIYDGNRAFPIQRFSGGEQDLANLCLRTAISQVVAERSGGAPINFIVLDEIFGSQDESRRELILNTLSQLSTQFRQIFVITHVESIKDIFPVLVAVQIKDDQVSEVKLV